MATSTFSLLLFSLLAFTSVAVQPESTSTPYLSPSILFPNYQKMLNSFKIYTYAPPQTTVYTTPTESLFYTSLLRSQFLTQDPNEPHLFLIPFPSSLSTRSLARMVKTLRIDFPYWNRTLGADHIYLSATGIDYSSDRNVVELKKNSVQISCFPTTSNFFIPHKDITLPPINTPPLLLPVTGTTPFLGYTNRKGEIKSSSSFIDEMNGDPDFVVESGSSDYTGILIKSSKYCVFFYGGEMTWMVQAMASGCVPVVITDRPIQDLPLIDVTNWSEIAVFVGTGGGAEDLKRVLEGIKEDRYEKMRGLGVTASKHLMWNDVPQPYDAFHMVIYQLWLRRHTIRYARV